MSTVRKTVNRSTLHPDLVRLLEDEAERHPAWPDVQNRLGLSLLARGRLTEAEKTFERCLTLNPRYAWSAMNLAQCLALGGRTDRAREVAANAAEPPLGARAFVGAFVEMAAGCTEAAAAHLDGLPATLARRPEFLRLRAALMGRRDAPAADALLVEARLDPELASFDLSPWDSPAEGPSALLTLVPGMHQIWFEASTLEGRMGHIEEAEVSAVRGYLHWSDLGLLLNQRGFLASLRDDAAGAVDAYQRAARVAPGDPLPHVSLTYHWSAAGEFDLALASLQAALDRAPRYADLHYHMGLLARARGDAEASLASFRRAIEINPGYRLARLDVATALFALKRWDEARVNYREMLAAGLASSDILLHLGEIEESTGDKAAAERCYHEALKLNPGEALAHYRLGNLCRIHGDRAGAQRAWKQFLTLSSDPDQAAVVEALLQEYEH